MPKVPIICRGGPFNGDVFALEAPKPVIARDPEDSCWMTCDKEPSVSGQGYYAIDGPTEMVWVPDERTP